MKLLDSQGNGWEQGHTRCDDLGNLQLLFIMAVQAGLELEFVLFAVIRHC
nr:hypothetical protein [Pseudomonas alkylphenolica]